MALDLSMLDDAPLGAVPANQIGAVLALRLDEVEEDPNQPRQVFDAGELESLAAGIRQRGVQAPITVRPRTHGVYRIVHGARRYRASKLAGLATIPAIVQADVRRFDDYSQILENLQRADLKPMEIAHFIRKRLGAGDSKVDIAQQLGMKPAVVTWHLALLDAAEPILAAFHEGRIAGAEQVYVLQRLYDKAPEVVDAFLTSAPEVTKRMIRELAATMGDDASEGETTVNEPDTRPFASPAAGPTIDDKSSENGRSARVKPASSVPSDTPRFKKPVLRARYDGQVVRLQLFRRAASAGWAFVMYEQDGDEEEVELARLSDWSLTEGA